MEAVDGGLRAPRTRVVVVLVGLAMRLRTVVFVAPLVGAFVLSGPAPAQDSAAIVPSAELLVGVGGGWRENPWSSLDRTNLYALVLMAAIRPPARRLFNFEAELGWWQEETARFGSPPDAAAVTTHVVTVGRNLFLLPRGGRFRPRAGAGLHVGHHFDTGTHTVSETLLGINASIGGELALTPRTGVYTLARMERLGLATFSRIYGGLRLGLGAEYSADGS